MFELQNLIVIVIALQLLKIQIMNCTHRIFNSFAIQIAILLFTSTLSYSQFDSLTCAQEQYVNQKYSEVFHKPDFFIRGREYRYYFSMILPNPLFKTVAEIPASIVSQGKLVEGIKVQYDLYYDVLIYRHPSLSCNNTYCLIELNRGLIDEFTLYLDNEAYTFQNLQFDSLNRHMTDGYYQMLYNEKSGFIIKHFSQIDMSDGRTLYDYSARNFFRINDKYYKIRKKRDIIRLMKDKSKLIRKFIRRNHIFVPKASTASLIKILEYYDSL